jgi:hypothetical protein
LAPFVWYSNCNNNIQKTTKLKTTNKNITTTMNTTIKTILVAIIFIAFNNSFAQVPISYYSFETGSTYGTFVTSLNQTINTVSGNTFGRNTGNTVTSTNGLGRLYGGARTGKAVYSTNWITSATDPGTAAAKYYTFKVNTSNFNGIGLKFDIWSGTTNKVSNIGILYSTNGSTFTALGTYDMSAYPGYVYSFDLDYSALAGLNNQSEVTFRIYGYSAETQTSYLAIDNMMVTALSTTGNVTLSLLSEPNIFSSYSAGLTGYSFLRKNFTVGSGSTVNLANWMCITGTFAVNGTLVCSDVDKYIQGYSSDTSSTFTLNAGATLKIGDADGISTSGILGNINTLYRNFSTDANYYYMTNPVMYKTNNKGEEKGLDVINVETENNGFVNNSDKKANEITKLNKDAVIGNTGNGLPAIVRSLTIDNTNNINLTNSVTVNNTFTLSNGQLIIGANSITLGANASVSGTPNSNNMVVASGSGDFRKIFNSTGSFLFPVGDNTSSNHYTPATITFTSGTFSNNAIGVKLETIKNAHNNSANDYLTRSWIATNYGVTNFTYNVSMQYLTSDVRGNENNIYFGKYDNGMWLLLSQANSGNHTLSASNLNEFSTFTGGEQGSMPVELTSFVSSVSGRDAKLNWSTASEENNSGFDIERQISSSNNWTKIGFAKGNGTTHNTTNYSFADSKLNSGKYNYRLKQIDNNGNFKYYSLSGTIEIGLPNKYNLSQNYPNPFNPVTKIDYDLPRDSKISIKLYDITGREIMTLVNARQVAGNYTIQVNANNLSSGIYIYSMVANSNGDQTVITKKMSVIK